MKKIKLILSILVFTTILPFISCNKGDSPVDQIVVLLDKATEKTAEIQSFADLTNVNNIISKEDIWSIIKNNKDYKLTKGDKEKLKKSYNKLVKEAYEKSCEFVPSDDMKKVVKNQLDLFMEAIDKNIENAETLGDIRSFN